MESSGSCSASTTPTFLANTSLTLGMAIRGEDNKLGHNSPMSSPLVEGAFKCKLCPRAFKTARARGGHQKAHRQFHAPLEKKKKAHRGRRPAWSPAGISPLSYATALRSACLHAQPFGDWRSHYDPSVRPVLPSFPWQTGTVGLVPSQPSSTSLVAQYRGTGDGGHIGNHQGVSGVNLEEPADGVDQTLKP